MAYLGEEIKKLGFGLMRLPKNGDVIDIEHTKKMVDKFLEAGYTYFDTAWAYPGSEDAIRQALVERYPREKYQLATKLAAWINCKTRDEAVAQFETSLSRTGAGYFDFYLLHNLGENRSHFFDDWDLWTWIQETKKAGKIKHAGFSFHSTADELEEILKKHPEMEFVQLQINYADWESNSIQSRKCYELCRKYNKPVIIMEPVKGGSLAAPPQSVVDIFKKAEPNSSPASWAVRFAAGLDGIITVLSGMSNIEQMEENISTLENFTKLTDAQQKTISEAQAALEKIPLIPCTTCNYCAKVCPQNIGISGSFYAMNMLTVFENKEYALGREKWLVGGHGLKRANECIKCGACEDACPQHIKIRDELVRVSEALLA